MPAMSDSACARKLPLLFLLFALLLTAAGCGGGSPGLRLTPLNASVQKPSNVAVYFTVETAEGEPVAGLDVKAFAIYEDGRLVSEHESKQTILSPEVAAAHHTLLLVDMSGSVTESEDLPTIVASARQFAGRVGKYQKIGVYAFDGGRELTSISEFTGDPERLSRGIEKLDGFRARDPSTNLNGAVISALRVLDRELGRAREPLRFGTLVIFTDGSDRAARVTREEVAAVLDETEHDVYVIGVGSEIDEAELESIGRSGTILSQKREDIASSFEEAAARIEAMSQRYYLLGYCSPSRAGEHEVTIEATYEGKRGSLSYKFSADGFGPDCDPTKKPAFDVRRPTE